MKIARMPWALALVVLLVLVATLAADAAIVRLGPAGGATILSTKDGDTQNIGSLGAALEVLAAMDGPGKHWVGFGGGYDGDKLAGAGFRYMLGAGRPVAAATDEAFAAFPFYLGVSLGATFLDPSSDRVAVSEFTVLAGPGLSVEIPIPGTQTFSATLGVKWHAHVTGDSNVESIVPIVLDIPAEF